jgi:hypothetical protein
MKDCFDRYYNFDDQGSVWQCQILSLKLIAYMLIKNEDPFSITFFFSSSQAYSFSLSILPVNSLAKKIYIN